MSKDEIDAWFFDLGGTLVAIEDDEIVLDQNNRITPLPGAMAALSQLKGEAVFVVSNQASVASGALPALQAYDFIIQLNALCSGVIRDFRFAMHRGDANHPWRKHGTGMVDDLALVCGLDLSRCVLIGDSVNDQRCAQAAGIGMFFWIDDFLKGQLS